MIGIIDYGMGNIHSVQKALESVGGKTFVTNNLKDFKNFDKIVLPGVGAFDDSMIELERRSLTGAIKDFIKRKKIFLGICLGLQLLFEESEEAAKSSGLGLLKGVVKKFDEKLGLKVPHMGWNELIVRSSSCPLLKDLPDKAYVYFCHSYYVDPQDKSVSAATCDYINDFTAVICKDNLYGVQFHPEKSQEVGLKILKNFVEM